MEDSDHSCSESSGTIKPVPRSYRRKTTDSDFKYNCEWNSCSQVLSSMNEFNHHVGLHRRGYTQCLGTDEEVGSGEYIFFCQWKDCNANIEGQIDDFSRHVFYHTFHQYLKFLGQHILTLDQLEGCQLDTTSRNVIPELPEKLMCRWLDCGMAYDNPYIFYSHVSHHCEEYPKGNDPKVVIKCKWEGCSITTKCWYKMKEHLRSHTQAKVIACPTCGSLFANNTKFIDHLKRQSPETDLNFECSHCNSRFGSERILRDHVRRHVNHYKCPLCDMTCHSPSAVREHVRYRHSQERSFHCDQCEYKAKTANDLRRHGASHIKKDMFSCSKSNCDKVFKTRKELMGHYSSDHELCRQYQCHICSKLFAWGRSLTNHLVNVHSYIWPSGHKRFRYKLHENGIRRLQTIRYESIEVSQQVLGQQLSPQQTSLHIVGSNSEVTGDDVHTLKDVSSEVTGDDVHTLKDVSSEVTGDDVHTLKDVSSEVTGDNFLTLNDVSSEVTGDDVHTLKGDSSKVAMSNSNDQGVDTKSGEHLRKQSSCIVYENVKNVQMEVDNLNSDAGNGDSPCKVCIGTDNELNVNKDKQSVSLAQRHQSVAANRRLDKKSQAAVNDISDLTSADNYQAEICPKRVGRKRKKGK